MLEQNQLSFFFDHSGESSTNAAPDIGGRGRLDGNATTDVVGVDTASTTEAIGLVDRQRGTQQGKAPRAPKVRKPRTPPASRPCAASPASDQTAQVGTCPPSTVHTIVSATSTDLESAGSVCALIDTWEDLSDKTRTDYKAAIRKAFEILIMATASTGRPASLACEPLNAALWARPPIVYGINSKGSFNNAVSRIRRVMIRLGVHTPEMPLTPEWQSLFNRLPSRKLETKNGDVGEPHREDCDDQMEALDPTDVDEGRDTTSSERRKNLVTLLRYCSSHSITPAAVTQDTFDAFCQWRLTHTIKRDIPRLNRITASNWEWARGNIPGWPQGNVDHPGMQDHYTMPLTAFPESFQLDVATYIGRREADPRETMFSRGRIYTSDTRKTPRSAPRKAAARTIDGLRRNIAAAATALVLSGIEIAKIRSLQDLVSLPNAEIIVRFHLARRQAAEKVATVDFH